MISKTQLEKKITEKAGLLPFDSQQFFESFLVQFSYRIKPGDVYSLHDIGFFSLRNCIVRLKSEAVTNQKELASMMVLFSGDSEFYQENKNIHFFNIPELASKSKDEIESHFSLSEDKPLANEGETDGKDFSSMKSSSEIKSNFIAKADAMIDMMEKLEGSQEEDFLIQVSPEDEFDNNSKLDKFDHEQSQLRLSSTSGSLFVSDKKEYSSTLPWDFGRKFFERKIDYPERDKFDTHEETAGDDSEIHDVEEKKIIEESVRDGFDIINENKTDELNKKDPKADNKFDTDTNPDEEVEEETAGNYERVKTFASNEMKKFSASGKTKPKNPESEKSEAELQRKSENDFTPVRAKYEAYQLISNKRKKQKQKALERNKKSISLSESKEKYDYYRQNKKVLPFVIPFLIIVLGFCAVYIYIERATLFSSEPESVVFKVTPPPHVNIIERDFEYAVTFPYAKSEIENKISGIEPSVFTDEKVPEMQKPEPEKITKELKTEQPVVSDTRLDLTTEREKGNKIQPNNVTPEKKSDKRISKYKDYFVVQVSSYKTYEAAEVEVEKFRNQGYNAFIEIAELPGRGTWYRIKVGDFTSEKHAEDFLVKNRN